MYPSIEAASPEAIKTFQEEKLRTLMGYLDSHSAFYQKRFKDAGVQASEIRTLEDLQKLPVTTKDDLHKYNDEFICVPREKIVDYITTSGTLGDPVTFTMTQQDLDRLAYNEYISFLCADGSPSDIYQLMVTLDRRFMAGLAYFLGLKKMGAGV
ncbi:MAG: phenylacetate--CoA ligase family protein, partial [Bacteroidota bacterium]